MKHVLIGVVAAALTVSAAQAQTVVIVRHAEKVDQSADPALSAAGQARATALAAVLADSGVTRVLVTPLIRTSQTAAPAATAAGVEAEAIALDGGVAAHAARVATAVGESGPEDVILIVGHSNTVPDIARALGDANAAALADCDYDRLLVLRLGAQTTAMRSRYGAPSASC